MRGHNNISGKLRVFFVYICTGRIGLDEVWLPYKQLVFMYFKLFVGNWNSRTISRITVIETHI